MAVLPSDLPPAYSTLNLSPEEVCIAASFEQDMVLLIGKSFQEKNARVMFTLKVISILLLQSTAVGIVLGLFAYHRITMQDELIRVAAVVYFITVIVMTLIDHVKNRNIYNYVMIVYYPISVTFVIVTLPTLLNFFLQAKFRQSLVCAWMCYILAVITLLFYCIFSLDCKHNFKLLEKYIITVMAFIASYFGLYIPLCSDMAYSNFDPISTLWVTLCLYAYYFYVLYAIDVMTSGDYRSPLTPADYVTAAVNVHIDYLFIIRDFIHRTCCCGCCSIVQ